MFSLPPPSRAGSSRRLPYGSRGLPPSGGSARPFRGALWEGRGRGPGVEEPQPGLGQLSLPPGSSGAGAPVFPRAVAALGLSQPPGQACSGV